MQATMKSPPGLAKATDAMKRARTKMGKDVLVGLAVVIVALLVLGAVVLVYVRPPDRKMFVFMATDVSSITVGEDVRVSGLSVGKVTKLDLAQNVVRVHAEVSADTFVGDESKVEVRMLTPVGGYAVTLIPLGGSDLGNTPIPADSVTLPYAIGDVLQKVPRVTDDVDPTDISGDLNQVSAALMHNSLSVGSMVDGMKSVTRVLDRQRSQVDSIASLSAEYFRAFNANRTFIFDLVRQIDVLLTTYNTTHVGFNEAYRLLGLILDRVQPEIAFYLKHSDQIEGAIKELGLLAETSKTKMGPAIDKLTSLQSQMVSWLGPQGMAELKGGTVLAGDICLPVPGRKC